MTYVICSFCGSITHRQNAGDGCHSCSRGTMRACADGQAGQSSSTAPSQECHAAGPACSAPSEDFAHLSRFYTKHALGSLLPPSCLVCGKTATNVAIRHGELANIVVCSACRDKVANSPDEALIEEIARKHYAHRAPIFYCIKDAIHEYIRRSAGKEKV